MNDCQYVAIKDNIGLCTYCRAQDHRYAACSQRIADQEATAREKKKNKKNSRKRGKVKIVAGVMTREQDSDSTLPPKREGRGMETPLPSRPGEGRDVLSPRGGGNIQKLTSPSRELICSFCGVDNHDYKKLSGIAPIYKGAGGCIGSKEIGCVSTSTGVGWIGVTKTRTFVVRGGDPMNRGKCLGKSHQNQNLQSKEFWVKWE